MSTRPENTPMKPALTREPKPEVGVSDRSSMQRSSKLKSALKRNYLLDTVDNVPYGLETYTSFKESMNEYLPDSAEHEDFPGEQSENVEVQVFDTGRCHRSPL